MGLGSKTSCEYMDDLGWMLLRMVVKWGLGWFVGYGRWCIDEVNLKNDDFVNWG